MKATNKSAFVPPADQWTHEVRLLIVTDNAGAEWMICADPVSGLNVQAMKGGHVTARPSLVTG